MTRAHQTFAPPTGAERTHRGGAAGGRVAPAGPRSTDHHGWPTVDQVLATWDHRTAAPLAHDLRSPSC